MQDMFGTVQQGNSPVRNRGEATASGDRWIEEVWSKGKAVNAPALPSHREFADILQQTYENPYKSNKPEEKAGDAWLTSRGKAAVPGAVGESSPACSDQQHPGHPQLVSKHVYVVCVSRHFSSARMRCAFCAHRTERDLSFKQPLLMLIITCKAYFLNAGDPTQHCDCHVSMSNAGV